MTVSDNRLDQLLERYFEGLTSGEEEKEIRRLFHEGDVPEHLEVYRSLFAWLEAESTQVHRQVPAHQRTPTVRKTFRFHAAAGIAAGLLILIGMAGMWQIFSPAFSGDYVWIDGKRYTDQALIHQQARAAFDAVSFSQEDILFTLFDE